jgi:hypothetical protein
MSTYNFSENFVSFSEWTKEYCREHDKKIILKNTKKLKFEGGNCAGWCDGDTLSIATKAPLAAETYCHEFAHMTQAVEKSPLWETKNLFWDDLQKNKIDVKSYHSILETIELERDCEKRSLKFSKEWELFDNDLYAQLANAYLYYYQYVFLKRKWFPSSQIYNPIIVDLMPTKLLPADTFKKIDMDLMHVYDLCVPPNSKFHKKIK